ncbi:alpha/beta hydrolase [Sphingomonas sp.]|uniref:alpha/beta hydrolase n=1 Tax=Sphingomonas sp. TaxID=28214 RepID=UPI00286CA734|nr:alpha/beta hydrolase [Sphingomonas sp.]
MPSLLTRWLLIVALLALPSAACAGPVADRIYPAPQVKLTLEGLPTGTELLTVRSSGGIELQGIYRPATIKDRPLILLLHGNASSAKSAIEWLGLLADQGYGVLAAEYRGYSGFRGSPSEAGLTDDAAAFLAEGRRLAAGRPIWVIGHSIGGAVALSLSRRERLDQLVTIGTFTRLRDMAPKLTRALVPDEYRNAEAVAALDEPYALIHGLRDDIAPWQMGQELHKVAVTSKRRGASYILNVAGHQPDAALILAILESLQGPAPLPTAIRAVPFGAVGK